MRYIFVLVYWVLTYGAHAQTYPVQVTTTLIPPYSPVLSYYTAADANNLQVIIHVMELDRRDLRAKLRVTIEGAGVRLYTSPAYVPPALVLQGGVPEMLSGFDIRGYLNPNNLIFEGITRAEFIKSGKLPEGFYTFTIEVLEYNRSVRISNQSRANAWVVLNDPPLINFPFSGDKLRTTDPQNISFSWVGRHLASPNSAFSTEYEFTLYELYPGQTNPEVAVRSSNSIYRTTTTQSSLYYGPAEPQLIPGKKYAYRIRAYDVSGRDLFKNQGYSETNWFQYGDACLTLRSVTAEALDPYRIRISWEPEATHTGFVVSYREAGTDTWWKETTFSTSLVIPDLKKGTSYEYQVMGQCNQYEGETSTIQTISTEAEETEDPNFACGTDLIMPELSPNPLQKPLLPLDLFHIGGLDVVVHTVTLNADGSYSGMGHAPMPIFNGAGMRVKIRNVIINEDYYAIAGSVVTVYDTEGRFIVGNTDDLKGDLSEEDAAEDTTITDAPDDNLLAVEGEIGHVEVIAGELVVTDAEGNPIDIGTVELPAEGETLTLEDASGDTWVVDSEGNVTPGAGNGGTDPNTPGAVTDSMLVDSVMIEGLNRNIDLVVINTIASSFKPKEERLELTYTIKDALDLAYTKLEIYQLNEEDTTMVTFYTGLPTGGKVEFEDSRDDDQKGWSGKGSDGEFVEAGNYLVKLTATIDESHVHGFEDYEQFEVAKTDAEIYDFFVTDDDAWFREKEPPYNIITPNPRTNILPRGTQIAVLEVDKDSKNVDVAKIQVQGGEIVYTSKSNLTQVKDFPENRKYKLMADYSALKIPFAGNPTGKTFKKDSVIIVDKYFEDYVRVKGVAIDGNWIAKSSLLWIDLIDKEEFLAKTKDATSVGTKYTGNEITVACNICVRSALLIMKEDKALFPQEGSAFYDPTNSFELSYPKGYITNPGRAKNIKEDFDVILSKSDLNGRFTEIPRKSDEDWETYFKRLQDKADDGVIIVGTYLSSSGLSGHVMMITPGGLIDIYETTNEWGSSFLSYNRNIKKVPRVLECGTGARENEAPLCRNVDYSGATKRLKWFVYQN